MLMRLTPNEGVHSIMLNSDDMMEVTKADCNCSGYTCFCNNDLTHILMRSGTMYVVEESINTIEARINRINTERN
jgi:F420-dependent methylenetetrahydromethanopterin dehydrogenase